MLRDLLADVSRRPPGSLFWSAASPHPRRTSHSKGSMPRVYLQSPRSLEPSGRPEPQTGRTLTYHLGDGLLIFGHYFPVTQVKMCWNHDNKMVFNFTRGPRAGHHHPDQRTGDRSYLSQSAPSSTSDRFIFLVYHSGRRSLVQTLDVTPLPTDKKQEAKP